MSAPSSPGSSLNPSDRAAGSRGRIEPSLEQWDEVHFRTPGAPKHGGGQGQRPLWLWWVAAVAILVALLFLLRQPLADALWPESRAQQLRNDAEFALKEGRLTAANGTGARELYAAALALDPDRSEVREGLARVGQAALEQGRRALAQRRYEEARRMLDLARELAVPKAQTDALGRQLREREAATAGIDQLLAQAAAAREQGRLDGDNASALPLYQRILELQPNRTEALEGREDTIADLLQQSQQWLARGELAKAAEQIRRVQKADAGHADLPAALSQLTRAADRQREQAQRNLRRDRLEQAAASYRALLVVDAQDADAARGLERVATAYARRSEALAADFRFAEAQAALREARALAPNVPAITAAARHLARSRQTQARLTPTVTGAARKRQLRQLLADAAAAEARGDLLTPPGDSAFDKLKAARALAPEDPDVLTASARLLPAAKRCFEQELRDNRLSRAGACLDVRRTFEGNSADVRGDRRRLAQRWLAVGEERLGAGELSTAQGALNNARALDRGVAGLDAFAERLRAALAAAK